MNKAKVPLVAVVIGLLLTACSQQEQFPVVTQDGQIQAPAPAAQSSVAAPQAPQAQQSSDSGVSDMLLGGMIGYMLGGVGDSRERVVEHHYYSPPTVTQSTVRPKPVAKPVAKPAPKYTYRPAPAPRSFSYSRSGRR